MNASRLHKILLVMFLIIIFLLFYKEVATNIQQIRMEYAKNQDKDIKVKENKSTSENLSTYEALIDSNEQEPLVAYWKPIERRYSYNNELQFYSKDNVFIDGDYIEITSKKETKENKMYTSGLVESTHAYKYGYFEFTIEVSKGKGLFPAIWLLPINESAFPEIDIFEMIGSEPYTFYGVIHYQENGINNRDYFAYEVPPKDQYSVALEWSQEALTWYIDNKEIYTSMKGVPSEYMYIIINQAIGGDWPGSPDDDTIFPNQFKVIDNHIKPLYMKGRN